MLLRTVCDVELELAEYQKLVGCSSKGVQSRKESNNSKESQGHTYEPLHDETNKITVRPVKIQISLDIRPVWSESSLSTWRKRGSLATHWAHSKDSDQTRIYEPQQNLGRGCCSVKPV